MRRLGEGKGGEGHLCYVGGGARTGRRARRGGRRKESLRKPRVCAQGTCLEAVPLAIMGEMEEEHCPPGEGASWMSPEGHRQTR